MLEDLGFTRIEEAEDGEQALELIRSRVGEPEGAYAMVLTDWLMPGLEGVELVRELRSEASTRSLPVLMVTSQGQRDQWSEALSAGVTGFVVKPFDEKQLAGEVLRILGAPAPAPGPGPEARGRP